MPRPDLALSALPPLEVDLVAGGCAWLVCPDCRRWVEAANNHVQAHASDRRSCPGSARRIVFDLTFARHDARRTAARNHLRPQPASRVTCAAMTVQGSRRPQGAARTTMAAAFETAFEKVAARPTTATA
jgi:hypothetical protein